MSNIIKEKNFLKVTVTTNGIDKVYSVNINNGDIIGLKGKPLKSLPIGFKKVIYDNQEYNNVTIVLNDLLHKYSFKDLCQHSELLSIVDKLDAINYTIPCFFNIEHLYFIKEHFSDFAKEYKNHSELTISDFYKNKKLQYFLLDNNLTIDDHFNKDMAHFIFNYQDDFTKQNYKWIKYYLVKGLWDFFENDRYGLRRKLQQYFSWCKYLNQEPQKTDFIRAYNTAKYTYMLNKEKYDNELLRQNQAKNLKALSFENEDCIVIVPFTSAEFINEANQQHNCVARMYMSKVIDNLTNIVFIRNKNNIDKSYITCEVNNGKIIQYLKAFNSRGMSEKDLKFKTLYQKHINSLWDKVE